MNTPLKPICPGCGKPVNSCVNEMVTDRLGTWHKICYSLKDSPFKQLTTAINDDFSENDWYFAIFEYLYSKVCLPNADWVKIACQLNNYKKNGMTYKSIYYSLVYYYAVMHGDPVKAQGGIGIVSYIKDESAKYWQDYYAAQVKAEEEIHLAIEKLQQLETNIKTVARTTIEPVKKDFSQSIMKAMEGLDD